MFVFVAFLVLVLVLVLVQGGAVPWLTARLRVPVRIVEPGPWSLGVQLRHEPDSLRRVLVVAGSAADRARIDELAHLDIRRHDHLGGILHEYEHAA